MDIDVNNLEFPLDGTNALVLPANRKKENNRTRQVDFLIVCCYLPCRTRIIIIHIFKIGKHHRFTSLEEIAETEIEEARAREGEESFGAENCRASRV